MKSIAQKCERCKRPTLDPSGFCLYHKNSSLSKMTLNRNPPLVKAGVLLDSHKQTGWLSEESGIDISEYSNGEVMIDMEESEQFSQWMKARISIRAIESMYAKSGKTGAASYAERCDDTSLALIWERLNNSTMTEFLGNGNFIPIVRQEVERRVDKGVFSPMDVTGYIKDISSDGEPQSSSSFL